MANLEVLSLDPTTPQIRAPGAGDGYSVPRDMTFATGTTLNAPTTVVSVDTATDALRITQVGSGNALLVEDSANPDATPTVITATGNVGIGTASPTTKLDVNGVTKSQGNLYGGTSNTTANVLAYANVATGGAGFSQFLFANTSTETRGFLTYSHASDSLLIGTAATTQATLSSSGNLGIGTTSPTAKLEVAGIIKDAAGDVRSVPQSGSNKTTSYTLETSDVGKFIGVGSGGSITVPNATFATGDVVSIFNNTTGNVTLTMTITTAYIGGTDADKATITLATRGIATILFISGTVCVVNGNVS